MKKSATTLVVILFPLLLFILTMPTTYTIGDPFDELSLVESGDAGIRPHHLFLTLVFRGAATVLSPFPGTLMLHLEIFVVMCGVLTLLGVFFLGGKDVPALGVALFFAVANGIWIHSSTIETGVPALCALTWGLYFYTHAKNRTHTAIALSLYSFSVLLHAHNLVLLPAFLLASNTGTRWLPSLRTSTVHALLVLLGTGIVTVAAAVAVTRSAEIPALLNWLFTHHSSAQIEQLGGVLTSTARSVSGLFAAITDLEGGGTTIRHALTAGTLDALDFRLLIRPVVAGALFLAMIVLIFKGRLDKSSGLVAFLLAFTTLLIVNSFWLGSDPQFWLGLIPFLAAPLSAGIRIVASRRTFAGILGLSIPILLLLNIPVREPSLLFPNGNQAHRQAMHFNSVYSSALLITPGSVWTSVVSISSGNEVHQMFRWSDVVNPLATFRELVRDAQMNGRTVFLEGFGSKMSREVTEAWRVAERVTGMDARAFERSLLEDSSLRLMPVSIVGVGKRMQLRIIEPVPPDTVDASEIMKESGRTHGRAE